MPSSADRDYFFQTSHSVAETARKANKSKNRLGSPLRLPTKVLAVLADPFVPETVYVAESAGLARKIALESNESTHVYRGPSVPITSLALSRKAETLYAGSWDKSIWSWETSTSVLGKRFHGHTDFVKSLLCFQLAGTEVLISGGADACIIIWTAIAGEKLHVLKGHTRGILSLALDPASIALGLESDVVFFSASSDPHIRRWSLKANLSSAAELEAEKAILQHETSVNLLYFDDDHDLWTASSDGTAKCLTRDRGWQAETMLTHGDYVRHVLVDEVGGWVVTVGRNEEVKIWERGSGKLWHTYSGHFEEITGCVLLQNHMLVTVGIDQTVRQWSLRAADLQKAKEETDAARMGIGKTEEQESKAKSTVLTEEEEQELAELLDDY